MNLFVKMLPILLGKVIPPRAPNETEAQYAERIDFAREAFNAFGARDPIEGMLALQAVGAPFRRDRGPHIAVRPDTDLASVSRARANGN